jgi:hypothetical protein
MSHREKYSIVAGAVLSLLFLVLVNLGTVWQKGYLDGWMGFERTRYS